MFPILKTILLYLLGRGKEGFKLVDRLSSFSVLLSVVKIQNSINHLDALVVQKQKRQVPCQISQISLLASEMLSTCLQLKTVFEHVFFILFSKLWLFFFLFVCFSFCHLYWLQTNVTFKILGIRKGNVYIYIRIHISNCADTGTARAGENFWGKTGYVDKLS